MPNYIFSFILALAQIGFAFLASRLGHLDVSVTCLFFTLVFVGLGLHQMSVEDQA